MLKCLIEEINEAFQTDDFPVLDAFHAIDPRYFHKIAESSRGTLLDMTGMGKIKWTFLKICVMRHLL